MITRIFAANGILAFAIIISGWLSIFVKLLLFVLMVLAVVLGVYEISRASVRRLWSRRRDTRKRRFDDMDDIPEKPKRSFA